MQQRSYLLVQGVVLMLGVLTGGWASAGTYSTDFSEFSLGSWVGQQGWYGNGSSGTSGGPIDMEVADLGGNQVMRMSNAATSGNYGTTHPAPPEVGKAGESSLPGAVTDTFQFSFDFRSATGALQDDLVLDVTLWETGTASRQGIVRIYDDATDGLSIGWWEVVAGSFQFVPLATGLDRNAWHEVAGEIQFVDGADNDIVSVSLNGSATSLTSWESFYVAAGPPQPALAGVDNLIFRAAGTPNPSAQDGGLYFDNLQITSVDGVPEPTTALLGLLAAGALTRGVSRRQPARA